MPIAPNDTLLGGLALTYEEITVTGVATSLSSALASALRYVYIRFDVGPIRYRVDGGAPTAAIGQPAYDGDFAWLSPDEARRFQGIRTGVTNGLLRVQYYG